MTPVRNLVKETLKDHFGLAVADGIAQRQQIATVQAACDAATAYVSREALAKADARAGRWARPMGITDKRLSERRLSGGFRKEGFHKPCKRLSKRNSVRCQGP